MGPNLRFIDRGALLIGLTVPKDPGERMINDLVKWYAITELPTFKPTTPKATIKDKDKEREFKGDFKHLTISNSPICHQSVGRWMKKNGADWDSDPEKKQVCYDYSKCSSKNSGNSEWLVRQW